MWTRAKVGGPGKAAPAILGSAFLSFIVACGGVTSAQTPTANQIREQAIANQQRIRQMQQEFIENQRQRIAQNQQQASRIQQDMLQRGQVFELTRKIGELQVAFANLTIQISDMCKEYPAEAAAVQQAAMPAAPADPLAELPDLKAAIQAVADAQSARDSLIQKLLAGVHDSAEYKQATAALESARADLAQAKAAGNQDEVVALAYKILTLETALRKFEPQALDTSAELRTANARLDGANQYLINFRANLNQAGNNNAAAPWVAPPVEVRGPGAQIHDLICERDRVNAHAQALLRQLAAISTYDANLVAQQGEGILEEQTQLHRQRQQQCRGETTAAGAPLIHFSPQVSPQVQQFLQANLDEAERMKNPVYAAEKARQAREEAELQQEQMQPAPDPAAQRESDRLRYHAEERRREEEHWRDEREYR
jgi:hypothetical protein